jgi:hypothetical protein
MVLSCVAGLKISRYDMNHMETLINTNNVPAQTSVPDWLMTYCRQLAEVHYSRKLNRMYVHMLECFLAHRPWEAKPPFGWKVARVHRSSVVNARKGTDLGWAPMNMMLPQKLNDQIKSTIAAINNSIGYDEEKTLSLRTFLYTAVCWWCVFVYPYEGPGVIE